MPMGIISDAEFESQLDNVTTNRPPVIPVVLPTIEKKEEVLEGEVVEIKSRGRSIGDVNVPSSLRALIAGTAAVEGRPAALELARDFGVSASSVSAYSKGATSTTSYNKPDENILNFIKQRKARVTKKALRVMTASLDMLTPEKLMGADAKDLSSIAKDMSAIVGHFNNDAGNENPNTGPTFVLYAPQVTSEEKFVSIQAAE